PKGRGRVLTPPPVKCIAQDAGIDVLQPSKIKTEDFLSTLRNYDADVILVAAYGRILPPAILSLPRLGCINVHGSILPKYRGAAPIQTAILRGERAAGVTIMQMDAGLDTGDMLLVGSLPIDDQDTSVSMIPKLAALGAKLLLDVLPSAARNGLVPQKQDDSLASLAPPLTKEDAPINWQNSASAISCQIRALEPWPLAHTSHEGKQLKPFCPVVVEEPCSEKPGTIVRADKQGLLIACGEGQLLVREIQFEGKKRMPVHAFLLGHPLRTGTVLT
ncbi:MAG: methionyl-tRNA formyltransferase, partial [Desulfobulbaceae bacterium]|nr:methionyl-tRNA formyltransferase [Desulfobulbaceae bacterium]